MKYNIETIPSAQLRSRTKEVKFLLSPAQAVEVKEWSRRMMPADSHANAEDSCYQITSLYFDTPQWDVFNKQGSYRRSKYRIRCYGDERIAFLERKIKTCGDISKWRSPVPLEELFYLLTHSPVDWRGHWFHRRLRVRRLQPVCRIGYRRLAREGQGRFGRFRLTLDESIQAEEVKLSSFGRGITNPGRVDCCPQGLVLELKFNQVMPVLFKQLIEEFNLSESPFSKYRSAVEKLGLDPNPISSHA